MASETPARPAPSVRVFACPNCGASLTIRAVGLTKVVACGHCGSTVDAEDEKHAVLTWAKGGAGKYEAFLPIGTFGKFRGDLYEVIGFMVRSDRTGAYEWREYLLYNPYKGFRWLNEYNGHWTFFQMLKTRPERDSSGTLSHLGVSYKLFQEGTAKVQYVLGEFYWEVKRGDESATKDYIAPPYVLSFETDRNETIWSLGEYVSIPYLKWAFNSAKPGVKFDKTFPAQTGVAPNEPTRTKAWLAQLWPVAGLFMVAAIVLQIYFASHQRNQTVHEAMRKNEPKPAAAEAAADTKAAATGDPKAAAATDVLPRFDIAGSTGNVTIEVYADVNNTWMSFDLALINADTGTKHEAETEVGYYSGWDSDGSWSEGSRHATVVFAGIPGGSYYITCQTGGDAAANGKYYQLRVIRDRLQWGPFWLALFLILGVPGLVWLAKSHTEYRRWQDSDFPWFESGS